MGHSVVIRKNIRRRCRDAYVYVQSIVLEKRIVKRLHINFGKIFLENRNLALLVVKNEVYTKNLAGPLKYITIYLPFY